VVTTAGDRGKLRRARRRHPSSATPAFVGASLQKARVEAAVTLAEVHDRTGILWPQLEGLEAGDFSRFADKGAAVTAIRRYADLVRLDGDHCARVVEQYWGSAPAGFGSRSNATDGTGSDAPGGGQEATVTGHLRRFAGDDTHLRAFTQTAQVPGVRRNPAAAANGHERSAGLDATGTFPAVVGWAPEPRAPWLLRAAVWLSAFLLVVAGAGLAVHHWRPQWLKDIHLVRHHPMVAPGSPSVTLAPVATRPARPSTTRTLVTVSDTGAASATASVRAASYNVVVAAWAPCWVSVTTPGSFAPVFRNTMPAGQVKTFASVDGQLTVNVGASLVTMQVQIGGKTVSGWLFKPANAPFTVDFASSGS
jgi:hypothetical protein